MSCFCNTCLHVDCTSTSLHILYIIIPVIPGLVVPGPLVGEYIMLSKCFGFGEYGYGSYAM